MAGESLEACKVPGLKLWHVRLEQAIQVLLLVFIASLPFRQLLMVERNGFLVLLGLLLLWSLIERQAWYVRTPFDVPLLAFVGWVGMTIPFASFPDYSLKEFGKLLQGIAIFYAVVKFMRPEGYRERLLYLLVGVVMIVSAGGLYQFDPANYQATRSFLSSEVWLTTFLVMFIPLCVALAVFDRRGSRKAAFLVIGVMATGCLLATQSRAGVVALLVESWVFAWLCPNRTVRISIGALTSLILAGFAFVAYVDLGAIGGALSELRALIPIRTTVRSVEHRFDIWSFAFAEIAKHPITGAGYGPETLRLLYSNETELVGSGGLPIRNVGTHNIFLYMSVHIGIPGLLLFAWVVTTMLRRLVECYVNAVEFPSNAVLLGVLTGVAGLLTRLQFDQMFVGTLALLFWVMIGLAVLHIPAAARGAGD